MDNKVLFAGRNKIGFCSETFVSYLNSQYLARYKKNLEEIRERKLWKSEGQNARHRGDISDLKDIDAVARNAAINGLAFMGCGNKAIYSVSVDEFSGIFIKDLTNAEEVEGHIIHDTKVHFDNLDYNLVSGEIIVAVRNSSGAKHLALFTDLGSHYRIITEGDSVDSNPVWGKRNPKKIFYDSKGIGRNQHGATVGYSPLVINRLDLNDGEIEELIAMPGYDCFQPKTDHRDNVYFIKRPYKATEESSVSFKDILLIPVKVVKAIFGWISLFTMMYGGEQLTPGSANPAKLKNDPKQILINDNLINAEKSFRENEASGEKFPGIVPKSWELMKRDGRGTISQVKKGVLAFDITEDGEVIYSNGKHLVKIDKTGEEQSFETAEFINNIKVFCKEQTPLI